MSKAPLSVDVRIADLPMFEDILKLLQELAEKDDSVGVRLAEIMTKHSPDSEYTYEAVTDNA